MFVEVKIVCIHLVKEKYNFDFMIKSFENLTYYHSKCVAIKIKSLIAYRVKRTLEIWRVFHYPLSLYFDKYTVYMYL